MRTDLESTIAYVHIPAATHSSTEEFVRVQTPTNIVYIDSNGAGGIPIGVYCVTQFWYTNRCLTQAELDSMATSTFNGEGYNQAALYTMFRNSILDAASSMPTWKLIMHHASSGPSPLGLVQNNYQAIKNNSLIDRVMVLFTWLGRDPPIAGDQTVLDDVTVNFVNSDNGIVGWNYHDTALADQLQETWCAKGPPIQARTLLTGADKVPSVELDAIYQTPDCGIVPLPSPSIIVEPSSSPVPSPSKSPEASPGIGQYYYRYEVAADLQSYTLTGKLEAVQPNGQQEIIFYGVAPPPSSSPSPSESPSPDLSPSPER